MSIFDAQYPKSAYGENQALCHPSGRFWVIKLVLISIKQKVYIFLN